MPSVSLNDLMATKLGVSVGTHTMEDLVINAYTRTPSTTVPARLNPFSVFDHSITFTAPHSLNEFENYNQAVIEIGSTVAIVMGPAGWSVSWGAAAGFESAVCKYRVYWKNVGSSEDLASLPLTGASPAFIDAGASLSIGNQSVSVGDWIAVVIVAEFNDGRTVRVGSTGFPGAIGQNELTGADEGVHSLNAMPSPTPNVPTAVQINPAVGACDGETTATLRVTVGGFAGAAQTLQVSKNGGTYSTLVTTIVASSSYNHSGLLLDNGDTYTFKAKYTVGTGTYSGTDGLHYVTCTE